MNLKALFKKINHKNELLDVWFYQKFRFAFFSGEFTEREFL